MSQLQHVEPEVKDEEPEWVQQLRAAGYNVRRGTGEGRMNEIPDAFFYPPPSLARRVAQRVTGTFRRVLRGIPSTEAGDAHLP